MLEQVQPDVHLVSTLDLAQPRDPGAHQGDRPARRPQGRRGCRAAAGAEDPRGDHRRPGPRARTNRPRRLADVDWNQTIRANLRHYQPELGTIIPERLIGYARRQQAVKRDILLCVDQSGSMATSVVYSSIFAAVLASIRSLRTSLVLFDTAVST